MRRWFLPGLLALASVSSGLAALAPGLEAETEAQPAPQVTTPVFSLRRVPAVVTRTVAGDRLRADLDALVSDSVPVRARESTCLAVSDPDGRKVYDRLTAMPLTPASTNKLLTATAVLNRMGADARFTTAARAAAPPRDGSVDDLWLVGSGDPILGTADFSSTAGWLDQPRPFTSIESLADNIVNAGVRRIGRLLGDESRYDGQRYIPTWESYFATNPEVGPQSALTVNNGFTQWEPRLVAASAPATHGATVLANLLRGRGVTVGAVSEGRAPQPSVAVASVDSPPVSEVVGTMVRDSDNLGAELLVKELGARFGGAGTTAAGLAVVRDTLAGLGLPVDALATVDGSGLDYGDRLTCGLLHGVLTHNGASGPLAQQMALAGKTGTLLRRFNATPAAGRVRAKTGSLLEVTGLSGFLTTPDGRSLPFSLVANGVPSEAAGMALQDSLVSVLATYPKAPNPEDLAPGPVQPPPPS